ncbi:hypothetical protein F4826_004891 [Rahnella inusitata]|nr:hypothetical protein [Rahnella inusitata]
MAIQNLLACIILPVLFSLAAPSYASAWVSTESRVDNGYAGQFSWLTEDDGSVICNVARCAVTICHYSSTYSDKCTNPNATSTVVYVPYGSTTKDAQYYFTTKNGTSGTWKTTTSLLHDKQTCFGILVWQGTSGSQAKKLPGAYCGKIPPPVTKCSISDSLVIDHAILSTNDVKGSNKTESIAINCSDDANVTLTLIGGRNISVGGNIISHLSIFGKDLSDSVYLSIAKGISSLPITSELSFASIPVPGNYQGSGVIIIEYQ